MDRFFRGKMSRLYVANLKNSGLFSAICALNRNILPPEKLNPDLFRASQGLFRQVFWL
jgi:hypothetical protein